MQPLTTDTENGQLMQLLSAELERARNLHQTLEQERQILVKGDPSAIRSISEKKQAQISALGEQLLLRDRFLAAHQLPAGKEGTELFIKQMADGSGVEKCWNQIQQLAIELNDRNEVNGGIVALAQRHVHQALDILTCQTEKNPTYGPAGQQTNRSPQSLAKV